VIKKDREKFTIVNHRDLKTSNVIIINYKGSPPYVQRIINSILRPYKPFARCYIDDIIIFSKIFEKYIKYLDIILKLFDRLEMMIKGAKTFLNYPSIILLDQRVDGFDITTSKKRTAVIQNLAFPKILKNLKIYLDFTGWLR